MFGITCCNAEVFTFVTKMDPMVMQPQAVAPMPQVMEAPMPQATISHRLNGNTVSLQCMGKQWSSNDTNWLGYDPSSDFQVKVRPRELAAPFTLHAVEKVPDTYTIQSEHGWLGLRYRTGFVVANQPRWDAIRVHFDMERIEKGMVILKCQNNGRFMSIKYLHRDLRYGKGGLLHGVMQAAHLTTFNADYQVHIAGGLGAALQSMPTTPTPISQTTAKSKPMTPTLTSPISAPDDPAFVSLMSRTGTWKTPKPVRLGVVTLEIEAVKTEPEQTETSLSVKLFGCCSIASVTSTHRFTPDFSSSTYTASDGSSGTGTLHGYDSEMRRAIYVSTGTTHKGQPIRRIITHDGVADSVTFQNKTFPKTRSTTIVLSRV